eukprot:m.105751 g.105751  ORF g.105751 m.105751 type:complete len:366 (+) comp13889_c0_seq2:279-1376(+)
MGAKISRKTRFPQELLSGQGEGNTPWGMCSMQGHRETMEDRHVAEDSVEGFGNTSFYAVLDGHAGDKVADLAAKSLLSSMLQAQNKIQGAQTVTQAISKMMFEGILQLDSEMHPKIVEAGDISGATCVSAFVLPTHIVVANAGDSRAIVGTKDSIRFATTDHKPEMATEVRRVLRAGGFVVMGRVGGNLAVSRALGDFSFKQRKDLSPQMQQITAAPDVFIVERRVGDRFLVLACDGIWDVMSNEQVIRFVCKYYDKGMSLEAVAGKLAKECRKIGSRDNMTVIIINIHFVPGVFHLSHPPDLLSNRTTITTETPITTTRESATARRRSSFGSDSSGTRSSQGDNINRQYSTDFRRPGRLISSEI